MIRAHLTVDASFTVGPVDRRLFGSMVEHLGRCVYDGIYEPGHSTADESGYRGDVIALVRELGVTTIRYPGGNFVSGYRWEDGVGPCEGRPSRLNLAWHSTETNAVGLDEFAAWLRKVDSELMYTVNLGTRGVQEALDVLEYANTRAGTQLSNLRIANGAREPHNIRMWCLGNEMDGPWQLGHGTAEEYASLAAKTARAMRQFDPDLELVVCGSSSAQMPTFGSWERTVLEATYDAVDYISCHAYYAPTDGDYASFLAAAVNMDRFIDVIAATADHVKAERGSRKTMGISFDEWGIWYQSRYNDVEKITDVHTWPIAPRLLEDTYSVMDAVVFGNLLISLIRHADRVTSASLAQLVNVIAPIVTEPAGPAWRQTTFFPFALTSRLARGEALELKLDCPTHSTAQHGDVPLIDAAATRDRHTGDAAVFLVNRDERSSAAVDIDVRMLGQVAIHSAQTLSDDDPHATNSLHHQERVGLATNPTATVRDGTATIILPPVSWTALTLVAIRTSGVTP